MLFTLLALASRPAAALDLSIGGDLSASSGLELQRAEPRDNGFFRLSPLAVAGGEAWELRLGLRLETGNAPAFSRVDLEEAQFRLWIGEHASISAGYGPDSGGVAEIFPLAYRLGPSDPLSRFESGGGNLRRLPEASLRLNFSGSAWRFSCALAPFAPPLVLPSLDSPWFPQERFPEEVIVSGVPLQFDRVTYAELLPSSAFDFDPAFLVSAGIVTGNFDLALGFFSGTEREASLFARIYDEVWQYRVELLPLRRKIEVFSVSATGIFGNLRVWTEAAYFSGISFATGSYEYGPVPGLFVRQNGNVAEFSSIPPILALDRYAATGGGSRNFELGGLHGLMLVEASYSWYPGAPSSSSPPELTRALAFALSLSDLADRLAVSFAGMLSFQDGSSVLKPSISLNLGGDRSLEASLPVFFGSEGEEFGRYRDHRFLVLSFLEHF